MIDGCTIVPILAVAFAEIVSPLLNLPDLNLPAASSHVALLQILMTDRPENKIFLPILAAISVVLAVRNHSRLVRWPPTSSVSSRFLLLWSKRPVGFQTWVRVY
jgi:hypothetical protein